MSSAVMTVVVDNVADDVLGVKEAATMGLELAGLVGARVTKVLIVGEDQIKIGEEQV